MHKQSAVAIEHGLMAGSSLSSRRRILQEALYGFCTLIAGTLSAVAGRYLFGSSGERRSDWLDAGPVPQLKSGVPHQISFLRSQQDGWVTHIETARAWVVEDASRRLTAFAPECTHLGCAYHWNAGNSKFVCPCHGSEFSVNGDAIKGPATRPLNRYQVRVEGGRIWLGTQQGPKNS